MATTSAKREEFWNPANQMVFFRGLLVFVAILLIALGTLELKLLGALLVPLSLALDYVDGWLARKFKCETKFGAFLDIVVDRISEYVYWVFFLGLGLVPIWVVVLIITRGTITDSIRTKALEKGKATYEMSTSPLFNFLVKNRLMRGLTNFSKMLVFTLLALNAATGLPDYALVEPWVYFTLAVNLARGVPVIMDGVKYF